MNDDTDALLEKAKQGATEAIEELFDRHRSRLHRMVSARLDNRLLSRFDPSDVVQDSLAEAHRQLPRYLSERSISFYPWLRRIADNRLVDLYRRHVQAAKRSIDMEAMRTVPFEEELLKSWVTRIASQHDDPARNLVRKESRHELAKILERLSPRDREILILRSVEQLSVLEAAEVLSIPVGTVKSRHFRALQRLKVLLQEAGWG